MAEIHRKKQYKRMDTWSIKPEVTRGVVIARSKKKKIWNKPPTTERLITGAKGVLKAGQKFAERKDVKSTTNKVLTFFRNYNNPRR